MLPSVLQKFSKIWPMSSANSVIINYLIGDIGYNPLSALNLSLTIVISLLFFTVGSGFIHSLLLEIGIAETSVCARI